MCLRRLAFKLSFFHKYCQSVLINRSLTWYHYHISGEGFDYKALLIDLSDFSSKVKR
jgi:hypothetical protein